MSNIVQTDASLGEDREHSAHAKGVHATKNDSQGGEKFSEVQCPIEEWERREGEVTEDRPSIHCSRRKSSEFLRKLSVYETGGITVLQRDTQNIPSSFSDQEFLNIDRGVINPSNNGENRKYSRTVPGRIIDGEKLLAEVPTNQKGDTKLFL